MTNLTTPDQFRSGEPASIAAIVPLRDKAAYLPRCLDSIRLAAEVAGNVEIIVVDNGSADGSMELVRRFAPGVILASAPGVAIGAVRNRGAAMTAARILCFLDADVVVPDKYFAMVRTVFLNQWVKVTGCRVALPTDRTWIERTWFLLHDQGFNGFRPYINSGNLVVRAEFFRAVGGFREDLATGEDAEFGLRVRRAGEHNVELRALRVLHLDNPTSLWRFYLREIWHARGMVATATFRPLDKPFALTVLHVGLVVTGFATLLVSPLGQGLLLMGALSSVVPVGSVTYRRTVASNPPGVFQASFLYHAYYLARVTALLRSLWSLGVSKIRK